MEDIRENINSDGINYFAVIGWIVVILFGIGPMIAILLDWPAP